jgi:hypothetical protein
MMSSHFGHSVLPTRTATGEPIVTPWRTPPVSSTSSRSNFIARRAVARASPGKGVATASVVISTPAGTPSSTATSAGPWDSPAVR